MKPNLSAYCWFSAASSARVSADAVAVEFCSPRSHDPPLRSPIRGSFGNLTYADCVLLVTTATEVWGFLTEAKKLSERRKEVEQQNEKVHRIESCYGNFSRSFRLPDDADVAAIQAESRNGILKVRVPKKPAPRARTVEVQVN